LLTLRDLHSASCHPDFVAGFSCRSALIANSIWLFLPPCIDSTSGTNSGGPKSGQIDSEIERLKKQSNGWERLFACKREEAMCLRQGRQSLSHAYFTI